MDGHHAANGTPLPYGKASRIRYRMPSAYLSHAYEQKDGHSAPLLIAWIEASRQLGT